MGKGARSREKNAGKRAAEKAQFQEQQIKSKKNKFLFKVVALVLVVSITATTLIYNFYFANGSYLRNNVTASTENFKVDNAMMTYYFENSYVNLQSQYGEYFSMFTGIDPTKSLKKQISDKDKNTTFFDDFLSGTKDSVQRILALAEAAKKDGFELTEEQKDYVDLVADNSNAYFLNDGVTKDDIRNAFGISYLAQCYTQHLYNQMGYTDDEINEYYEENENKYKSYEYRYYTIDYSESKDKDVKNLTETEAKEKADELLAAKDEDSFVSIIKGMIKKQDSDISDEDLETKLGYTLNENGSYVEDDEVSEWAFKSTTKEGDTYIVTDEEKETHKVYYIVKPAHRDETETRDVYSFVITDQKYTNTDDREAKAQSVLDEYNENPTQENFIALAKKYTEDTNSIAKDCLYDGILKDATDDDINDWIFDEDRKVADVKLINVKDATYVLYYVGEGHQEWQEQIIADKMNTEYTEKVEDLEKEYKVTFDDKKLQDLPV